MTTELTDNERALLAREVAADRHVDSSGWYNENMREVFCTGWDAAMEYVKEQQRAETELATTPRSG